MGCVSAISRSKEIQQRELLNLHNTVFFRPSLRRQETNLTEDKCGGGEAPFFGTREFDFLARS